MKNILIKLISQVDAVKKLANDMAGGRGVVAYGVSGTARASVIAALDSLLGEQGSLAFLVTGREAIREYRQTLGCFYPDIPLQELYPQSLQRVIAEKRNLEVQAGRAEAMRLLAGMQRGIVFVTAEALQQKFPRPKKFRENLIVLRKGAELDQTVLIKQLVGAGYEHTDEVDALGQFTVRGEIMDVCALNLLQPVRLEWNDDKLDDIRFYDLETRRSVASAEEVEIAPVNVNGTAGTECSGELECDASVLDYLAKNTICVVDEPVRLREMLERLAKEAEDYRDEIFAPDELWQRLEKIPSIIVSSLAHNFFAGRPEYNLPVRTLPPYNRKTDLLENDLRGWLADGVTPIVMMTTAIKGRGVADTLKQHGIAAAFIHSDEETLQKGCVNVMSGDLFSGFRFWTEAWSLLTENDIYGLQRRHRFKSPHKGAQLQYFSEIKTGDYVVHDVHGIGRYLGVENVIVDGMHRDYLLLKYAGDDKLYVPVDQVGLLHKYVGNEGVTPKLSAMGGADWKRMKKKATTAITELAEELLRLYANRRVVEGYAFSPDNDLQLEFEESFPFEETPDQLKAIDEIKRDMEKPIPMDRLLCGDVGYGKTEVALRAAFKAVMDGKQVAVLVPTTVLAQQHNITFHERLDAFGVRIAMLSRFATPKKNAEILEQVELGDVDIVIGTHRLLQSDVRFADLGLLIVDEEQRFGVMQKEKLKRWKLGVDVLTLSATPIPRTLHMALVNGRDMSVIETPPEDRLPVETYVAEYDDGMVQEAILREIRRGGRVYYVHNRVSGLPLIAARLRRLIPGVSIEIGHGRMTGDQLENAMLSFYEGRCDVLLCTTIVENGLDVPLANTIIVEGAENFGLSQLYQMRGRVGRSSRLAYAYFLYRKNRALSEVAEKRLQAIRDFTELGAGFKIAMRDLEIRGAGNLLGAQQHGFIAGIGFATYCDILEKTIKRLKGGAQTADLEPDPIFDLPLNAYIPDSYISDPRYKLELYRRFAELEWGEGEDLMDEIIDRFGDPPEEVEILWRTAKLKSLCKRLGVRGLSARNRRIYVTFAEKARVRLEALTQLISSYPLGLISLKPGKEIQLVYEQGKHEVLFRRTHRNEAELPVEFLNPLRWLEKNLPKLL